MKWAIRGGVLVLLAIALLVPGCAEEDECSVDADCEQNEQGEQVKVCKFKKCVPVSCEPEDPNNESWRLIKNANLRNVVREMLGFDDPETIVYYRHIRNIREIEAANKEIGNIWGLECFISLEQIWLDNNNIGDLGPFTKHPKLKLLSIGRNRVSNLSPLSEVFTLEQLEIADNNVDNLGRLLNVKVDPDDPESPIRATRLNQINLANNNVSNLTPLVDNPGIGSGDSVNLQGNSLGCEGQSENIQALRDRGVFLLTDCD